MDKVNLATVQDMWRREIEAATTYRLLADRERDDKRKSILMRLAEQEEKHAARWAERIVASTGHHPDRKEVERGLSWFQRISDPNVVLHRLEQEENRAEADYDQLMARLTDPADRKIAEEAMYEERDHAVVLRTLAGGSLPSPRSTLDTILRRERWHVRGTGWIGDAIYGVNDGLGAVFGIVSGMAGYTGGSEVVLAAGLAGTMASALSMGAGAYLASKSEREVYESEVARERTEIEEDPHEELLELELFYQLKGFSAEEARAMAERIHAGAEAISADARARRARPLRGDLSEPVALHALGDALDGDRRLHPDHPVFLHRGHAGGHRLFRHQHHRPLRRRRIEGAGDDAPVVGHRRRNDHGRGHRSGHHLRVGPGVRRTLKEADRVSSVSFPVSLGAATVTAHVYSASEPRLDAALMLAHGAGAGQHSPFMTAFADAIAARGIDVVTFNFLYTEQKRRLPDRGPVLEACYRGGDRRDQARSGERTARALHRRQVDGRTHRHAGGGGRRDVCRSPAWSCSDIRCIRREGPTSAATRISRTSSARCSSSRAAATPSGRRTNCRRSSSPCRRGPRSMWLQGGDHSFKVSRAGQGGQAAVYEQVQQTIASWIRESTVSAGACASQVRSAGNRLSAI